MRPADGAPIESEAAGAVNIEWLRRKGRFSLDVNVFGRGFAPHDTPARLCRAVARALGRAVLFSDCSAFGYSYFSAEPDGSIWAQLVVIGDDDDVMDLAVYAHPDPHHRYPRMTFAADEPLAERPPGAPTGWDAQSADCDTRLPGRVCRASPGLARRIALPESRGPGASTPCRRIKLRADGTRPVYATPPIMGRPRTGRRPMILLEIAVAMLTGAVIAALALLRVKRLADRQLRNAIAALPAGIAFYDKDDRLFLWNDRYKDVAGASAILLRRGMRFRELLEADLAMGRYPEAARGASASGSASAWPCATDAKRPASRSCRTGAACGCRTATRRMAARCRSASTSPTSSAARIRSS